MSTNPSDLILDDIPDTWPDVGQDTPETAPPADDEWNDKPLADISNYQFRARPAALLLTPRRAGYLNTAARKWASRDGEIEEVSVLISERKSDGALALRRDVGPIGAKVRMSNGFLPTALTRGAFLVGTHRPGRYELRALAGRNDMALLVRVEPEASE